MDLARVHTPARAPSGPLHRVERTPGLRRGVAPVLTAAAAIAVGTSLLALVLAGGRPQPVPAGLPDPGLVVGWGLRLTRLGGLLATVLCVGSLLVAGVLRADDAVVRRRALQGCALAATAWAAAAAAGVVLTVCDIAGVPVSAVDVDLLVRWGATGQVLAAAATLVAASLLAMTATRADSALACRGLLAAALAAALVVPLAGHELTDGGAGALAVHVVAALVWTGGLAGIVIHLHSDPAGLAAAVPRFSILALGAFAALAGSGLLAADAAAGLVGGGTTSWSSGYAAILGAKAATLLALGLLGARHRRRSLPRLAAGAPGAFRRLAAVEVLVMAAGLGLAAALARTPVPPGPAEALGHGASDADVAELSLAAVMTTWRPDAVVLLALGLAGAAYLHGVRALRRDRIEWPAQRTAAFLGGIVTAAVALCSGAAAYASLLLSVHLAQFLVVLLVVPLLLLLGRPLTVLRLTGGAVLPPGPARVVANPAIGAIATCGLLTVLLRTPLLEWSLSSPWWHLLVSAAALGCGLALLWPALGTDLVPETRSGAERAGWLVAVALGLTVLGLQLLVGNRLAAAEWFLELRLGWSDPVNDQQLAGGAVLAAAGALVVLALVLAGRSPGQSGHTVAITVPTRSSAGTGP